MRRRGAGRCLLFERSRREARRGEASHARPMPACLQFRRPTTAHRLAAYAGKAGWQAGAALHPLICLTPPGRQGAAWRTRRFAAGAVYGRAVRLQHRLGAVVFEGVGALCCHSAPAQGGGRNGLYATLRGTLCTGVHGAAGGGARRGAAKTDTPGAGFRAVPQALPTRMHCWRDSGAGGHPGFAAQRRGALCSTSKPCMGAGSGGPLLTLCARWSSPGSAARATAAGSDGSCAARRRAGGWHARCCQR